MSVRSNYSKDSYKNRPLTRGGSRRNRTPTPIPAESDDPCEACKTCTYKKLVERAMIEDQTPANKPVQEKPIIPAQESNSKKEGLLTRFSKYIAKNQAANRAAGDTSLTDDLQKWGGGILNGAGNLGQEEIDGLSRKKSVKKSAQEDDELIDFLTGKKPK